MAWESYESNNSPKEQAWAQSFYQYKEEQGNLQSQIESTNEVIQSTQAELKEHKENIFRKLIEQVKWWWWMFEETSFWKMILWLFWKEKKDKWEWNSNTQGQKDQAETKQENTNNNTQDNKETNNWTQEESTPETEKTQNWNQTEQKRETKEIEPKDTEIVPIKEYIPKIKYDIKYATTDNFANKKMYESQEQYLKLQYQAIKKLKKAEEIAQSEWLSLKIRDAYRPTEAQEALWNWYDDAWLPQSQKTKNVARPTTYWWKWSNHWRWTAIDLTIIDNNWNELEMPTKFDEFWESAHWDHVNRLPNSDTKKKNALKLKEIMTKAWFSTYKNERRHFEAKN